MEGTTKIVIVDLRTGEFKTVDSGSWMFAVHFSQSYETPSGDIVVETPVADTADAFVQMFLRENYNRIDKMSGMAKGVASFQRHTFNFE